jgi:hypothetical protein
VYRTQVVANYLTLQAEHGAQEAYTQHVQVIMPNDVALQVKRGAQAHAKFEL